MSAPFVSRAKTHLATLRSLLGANVLLAVLLTTVMAAMLGRRSAEELSALFVANNIVANCITLSFQLGFGLTVEGDHAQALQPWQRTVLWLAAFVACVMAGVWLGVRLVHALLPQLQQVFTLEPVLMVSVPVSLAMMRFAYLRQQREAAQAQKLGVETQLAEARLAALTARTQPHFLFNSLNSIAALVEDDPRAGEAAILRLARMFRYVLEGSRSTFVTLGDELEFVRSYLEMETLRFGERLSFALEVAGELREAPIPPLLLQPLVENAVHHGMRESGRGRVSVHAARSDDSLVLTVDDDGQGPEGSSHRGAGTSHETMRARLALLYGDAARLTTHSSPLGGFRAQVHIPWRAP